MWITKIFKHKKLLETDYFYIFLLFFLAVIFFYSVWFYGLVPIPFDILAGGYYPWLDYKWGYIAGVPVKNPILSDAVSQLYIWRSLAIENFKSGQFPLWNPYAFSGTPLLASWHSGSLYPFNVFLYIFGNIWGWTFLVMIQPFLSMLFMYLFLKIINLKTSSAIFGSIIFAFSGLMMTHLEFATAGHAFLWTPFIFFLIEKFYLEKKIFWIFIIPVAAFFVFTAGNFQSSFYAFSISVLYFVFRGFSKNGLEFLKSKTLILGLIIFLLCILISAIQLLPTAELLIHSIRGDDPNIRQNNFGLLPLQNLITFLAPDFFGNHSTGNFWGFNNYHETALYFGIISLPFAVAAFFQRRNFITTFFAVIFLISLLLIFDTFLGKLIYYLNVPLLSTSYASRLIFVLNFSGAILAAYGIDSLKENKKLVFKIGVLLFAILVGVFLGVLYSIKFTELEPLSSSLHELLDIKVSLRNLILPIGLIFIFLAFMKIVRNNYFLTVLIIFFTVFDLFRFGWKYHSFTPAHMNYPDTPAISFLKNNTDYYRIEREKTEVLPPNAWISYKLMSPSGYDPLYSKQYAMFYNLYNGNLPDSGVSRYAELGNYNSQFLDLAGVKYLMAAKRDEAGVIDENGKNLSYFIQDPKFKQVFEDKSVVVLENTKVLPRVILFDQYDIKESPIEAFYKLKEGYDFRQKVMLNQKPGMPIEKKSSSDNAEIINYQSNQVIIKSNTSANLILMLTDSIYPGWKVYVNGKEKKLLTADGIFRAVALPKGESVIRFIYEPESFRYGLWITLASFILVAAVLIWQFSKKRLFL